MIQLEVGKRYVRRDGRVTGPLRTDNHAIYPFYDPDTQFSYTPSGSRFRGSESFYDLVAEYSEPRQTDYDQLGDLQREHNEIQNKQLMQDELFTAVVKVGDRFHLVDGREAVAVPAPTSEPAIRTFASGATRNLDHNKLDYEGFNCPAAQRAFAEYMHTHRKQADGTMRAGDNWQKSIPVVEYMKSMTRHVQDLRLLHRGWTVTRPEDEHTMTGTTDEKVELLCAIWFNVQGMIHELLKAK